MDDENQKLLIACRKAVENYDENCREFLGGPSKQAIARKLVFLLLLSELADKSVQESLKRINRFYQNHSRESRLIQEIEIMLFKWFNISTEPVVHARRYDTCRGCQKERARFNLFHTKMREVKIAKNILDKYKRRKVERVIGQAMRNAGNAFWHLPEEVCRIIVDMVSSEDEELGNKERYFSKPKIKR